MNQFALDLTAGRLQRDLGIQRAVENAEAKTPGWTDIARDYLIVFMRSHNQFSGEMFREWAVANGLPLPPHLRAFGGVMRKAAIDGLIHKIGNIQVTNPTAHCATAGLWEVV